MKSIKISKRLISLLLTGNIMFSIVPANSEYEYIDKDGNNYLLEDWYIMKENPNFIDYIYDSIINYIPPFIVDYISNNAKIVSVGKDGWIENKYYFESSVKACYDYQKNIIYIETHDRTNIKNWYKKRGVEECFYDIEASSFELSKQATLYTLFHELGHMVDIKIFNNISNNRNFSKCLKEKNNFKETTYYSLDGKVGANINSNIEYFASSFAEYILHPNELLDLCPETFNFIDNLIRTKELEFEKENPEYDYYGINGYGFINEEQKELVK